MILGYIRISALTVTLVNIVSHVWFNMWFCWSLVAAFRFVQPVDGLHEDCQDIRQGRGTSRNVVMSFRLV